MALTLRSRKGRAEIRVSQERGSRQAFTERLSCATADVTDASGYLAPLRGLSLEDLLLEELRLRVFGSIRRLREDHLLLLDDMLHHLRRERVPALEEVFV